MGRNAGSTKATSAIKRMLAEGVPVGAGTDATRVASYNPWVALYWLVTGKTLGGMQLYPDSNLVEREQAARRRDREVGRAGVGDEEAQRRQGDGQPCDLDPILAFARKHGLRVIEDCGDDGLLQIAHRSFERFLSAPARVAEAVNHDCGAIGYIGQRSLGGIQ